MINKTSRTIALIVLVLWLLVLSFQRAKAQNVVLKGRTFIYQSVQKDSTDTGFMYQAKDSNKYTVYLSHTGKAYIYVRSKRTGKYYRKYLPKITTLLKETENGKLK